MSTSQPHGFALRKALRATAEGGCGLLGGAVGAGQGKAHGGIPGAPWGPMQVTRGMVPALYPGLCSLRPKTSWQGPANSQHGQQPHVSTCQVSRCSPGGQTAERSGPGDLVHEGLTEAPIAPELRSGNMGLRVCPRRELPTGSQPPVGMPAGA